MGIEVNRLSRFGSERHPDVYFDGRNFPLLDGSFESVRCSQVLEHVFEPARFLAEIRRVMKPGGKLLLTVASIFVQLWPASLEKTIRPWPRLARAATRLAIVFPCKLLGIILDAVSANRADLYLDNVALFERTDP